MSQKLVDIELDEVSLVDKGANQHAHVILMKAAPTKTEDGKNYTASDYAYVPNESDPESWDLRMTAEPGGQVDGMMVAKAVSGLSKKYGSKKDGKDKAKRKVLAAWLAANPDKTEEDAPASIKKALDDDLDGIWDEVEKAVSFLDAMNSDVIEDKLHEMMEGFQRSISSIMYDDEISNKSAAVAKSAAQFHAAVAALSKEYEMSDSNEELMQKVAKLEDDLKTATEANEKLTADLEAATAPEDTGEINKADLPEPVRKKLEEAEAIQKKMDEQAERIAKMEDAAAEKEWVGKSADAVVGASQSDIGKMLHKIAKHDGEVAEQVHGILKAAHAQIDKAGLFKSFGADGDGETETALEKVHKKAAEYAEKNGVSKSVAVSKVLESDNTLYADYLAEQH